MLMDDVGQTDDWVEQALIKAFINIIASHLIWWIKSKVQKESFMLSLFQGCTAIHLNSSFFQDGRITEHKAWIKYKNQVFLKCIQREIIMVRGDWFR